MSDSSDSSDCSDSSDMSDSSVPVGCSVNPSSIIMSECFSSRFKSFTNSSVAVLHILTLEPTRSIAYLVTFLPAYLFALENLQHTMSYL